MSTIEKLRKFRQERNLSVVQISKLLDINKHTYYKIESGTRKPTYDFMRRFKEIFGVSIDEMFF